MRIGATKAIALFAIAAFSLLALSEAAAKHKRHRRAYSRHWDTHYRVRVYDGDWRPAYRPRVIYPQPVYRTYERHYDTRWDDRDGWRFRDDWESAPTIRGSIQINP